ncbi:hypothetical protein B0I35DRAFT_61046 [Stachybotrys elegans]|uniref:Uncharacterized protein n=1 Tax=Stachybotrys elegans TaxID=80388 RepID=A0A8K0WNQ1_9HYPO|nr:hypothetical protein B0I35DRAFT_61046 [Stachybotrys elegans]
MRKKRGSKKGPRLGSLMDAVRHVVGLRLRTAYPHYHEAPLDLGSCRPWRWTPVTFRVCCRCCRQREKEEKEEASLFLVGLKPLAGVAPVWAGGVGRTHIMEAQKTPPPWPGVRERGRGRERAPRYFMQLLYCYHDHGVNSSGVRGGAPSRKRRLVDGQVQRELVDGYRKLILHGGRRAFWFFVVHGDHVREHASYVWAGWRQQLTRTKAPAKESNGLATGPACFGELQTGRRHELAAWEVCWRRGNLLVHA